MSPTPDGDRDVVSARSLVLIAGMTGVAFNGAPIRRGPEIVDVNGAEFVQIYTGDGGDPETFTRYLFRADVRIALRVEHA